MSDRPKRRRSGKTMRFAIGPDGHRIMRVGKTKRDHESGAWANGRRNREDRREENRSFHRGGRRW